MGGTDAQSPLLACLQRVRSKPHTVPTNCPYLGAKGGLPCPSRPTLGRLRQVFSLRARKADEEPRYVFPLRAREAQGELRCVQQLPSWQCEDLLSHVPLLRARKRKDDCEIRAGCPHDRARMRCAIYLGCEHGRREGTCTICSPCRHGEFAKYDESKLVKIIGITTWVPSLM